MAEVVRVEGVKVVLLSLTWAVLFTDDIMLKMVGSARAVGEAPEASSKEEPSKEASPTDPPGEDILVVEESAPAPVHVTQRATEQWSSLATSGPWARASFSKGLGRE